MKKEPQIKTAPNRYNAVIGFSLKTKSPTIANGIVVLKPTVTMRGDVRSIAFAQQKSEIKVMRQLVKIIDKTLGEEGHSKVSLPVKCNNIRAGHRNTKVNKPTKPKKIFMLILDSS